MKLKSAWLVSSLIFFLGFISLNKAFAGEFEGIVKMHMVSMAPDELPGSTEMAPSLEGVKNMAGKILSKPVAEIIAMGKSGESFSEQVMDIKIKNGKIRMDMNQMGQKMSIIYDSKTMKLYNIMWKTKSVMVLDAGEMKEKMKASGGGMNDMMAQMQGMKSRESKKYQFSMKPTGKKKQINGFTASQFVGNSERGEYLEVWLDKSNFELFGMLNKAFEGLDKGMEAGENKSDGEDKFIEAQKAIPVLRYSLSRDNLEIQEMMGLERKSLPASDFTVPANFKQVNLQEMMQKQFQQMQQMMQKGN